MKGWSWIRLGGEEEEGMKRTLRAGEGLMHRTMEGKEVFVGFLSGVVKGL